MALQNFNQQPIKKFLDEIYYIPAYQREYSWELVEIEDFWNDLKDTIEYDYSMHFFGQIVVHNDEEDNKKYIIDGQQRTITSMIFARALQLIYDELAMDYGIAAAKKKSNAISLSYLGYYDEEEKSPHLILGNETDNDYFIKSIIIGKPSDSKVKKAACDRMRCAFKFFYNALKKALNEEPDKLECINKYYNAFSEKFNVMYVEATKLEEAFIIFETLNARGKDLETSDLLKNYIFSKSKDIAGSQKKWDEMIASLDQTDPTKFIRHYWNSCHSFTRDKELYREICKVIKTPRDSNDLLTHLKDNAPYYHDMTTPDECSKFTDDKLINSLSSLSKLKAKTFYPIIMAMNGAQKTFEQNEFREVIETLELYFFKNVTICGKTGNRVEIALANIAKQIFDGELISVDQITKALTDEIVSDEEFRTSFELFSGKDRETIRYILRKICKYLDKTQEISLDNNSVHIEHIMPEDYSQWSIPEEIHDNYLWRLGNLTLLSGKLNISISNKPFIEKRYRYKESKIELNHELADYDHWDEDTIKDRQMRLAQYALKIWKK